MSQQTLSWLALVAAVVLSGETEVCQDPVYNRNFVWNTSVPAVGCINARSDDDVIKIVETAMKENASVRAIGKSYSWSAVGMMENRNFYTNNEQNIYMVNMTQYMRNYSIDTENSRITCQAGMRTIDVCEALEKAGLGLPYFGGPVTVNFVGSFNTGTHGKGSMKNAINNMASQVIELEIVLPNGTLVKANNELNSDIFNAAKISMGSIGIITKYTVQATKFYNITRYPEIMWENVPNNITLIAEMVHNNVTNVINQFDFIYGGYQVFRQRFQWQNFDYTTKENKVSSVCWNDTIEDYNEFPCTDAYYKAISPYPMQDYLHGQNHESEFYVLKEDFEKAFIAGIEWVINQKYENPYMWNKTYEYFLSNGVVNNYGEIQLNTRWIGTINDTTWLSPAHFDGTIENEKIKSIVQIGIYIPGAFDTHAPSYLFNFWVNGYYKAIKKAVNGGMVRVHWGKSSMVNHCDIENDYPKMNEFKQLRKELDPNERFVNAFVRDKLGLCGKCCCTFETCNKTENENTQYDMYF